VDGDDDDDDAHALRSILSERRNAPPAAPDGFPPSRTGLIVDDNITAPEFSPPPNHHRGGRG
jgi:hypothetical protein